MSSSSQESQLPGTPTTVANTFTALFRNTSIPRVFPTDPVLRAIRNAKANPNNEAGFKEVYSTWLQKVVERKLRKDGGAGDEADIAIKSEVNLGSVFAQGGKFFLNTEVQQKIRQYHVQTAVSFDADGICLTIFPRIRSRMLHLPRRPPKRMTGFNHRIPQTA